MQYVNVTWLERRYIQILNFNFNFISDLDRCANDIKKYIEWH